MAVRQALVRDAMSHLKVRNGARLAQIRKQLVSTYTGKLAIKNKMLTAALKGLVQKGQVEKNGSIFKIAKAAKANADDELAEVPSRRRRRRHHGGGSRRRHHRRRHRRSRKRHHSQRRHRRRRHHKRRRR